MQILNQTHYFNEFTKRVNDVLAPDSFAAESRKRQGYQQRMYFHQMYCEHVGGIGYFITLTYDNEHLPKNTFVTHDYNHIREITNGSMIKVLARKYHAKMDYFVACELGEGKGKRGKGNNPHYHILSWFTPLDNQFVKPTSKELYSLFKSVWPYGMIQPGLNSGVIDSTKACFGYVSKYVTKDTVAKDRLKSIYLRSMRYYYVNYLNYRSLYQYYLHLKSESNISRLRFILMFHLMDYQRYKKSHNLSLYQFFTDKHLATDCPYIFQPGTYTLTKFYAWYNEYLIPVAKTYVSTWWNRFGTKCRMSNNLGVYGLQFVRDVETEPFFVLETSSGPIKMRPCLYYLRKLYTRVVKDPVSGNPLYLLNSLGQCQKVNSLKSSIDKYKRMVYDVISSCNDFGILVPPLPYPGFYLDDLIYRYVVYKLVYEHRTYDEHSDIRLDYNCELSDVLDDYSRFIIPVFPVAQYRVSLSSINRDSVTFKNHPAFRNDISYFRKLDIMLSSYAYSLDEKRKIDFEQKKHLLQLQNFLRYFDNKSIANSNQSSTLVVLKDNPKR